MTQKLLFSRGGINRFSRWSVFDYLYHLSVDWNRLPVGAFPAWQVFSACNGKESRGGSSRWWIIRSSWRGGLVWVVLCSVRVLLLFRGFHEWPFISEWLSACTKQPGRNSPLLAHSLRSILHGRCRALPESLNHLYYSWRAIYEHVQGDQRD